MVLCNRNVAISILEEGKKRMLKHETFEDERDRLAEFTKYVLNSIKDGTFSEGDCQAKALELELIYEDIATEEDALEHWIDIGDTCYRLEPWLVDIESVSGMD